MKRMRVVLWVMVFGVITEALAMEPLRLIAPWTPVTVKTNASVVEVGVWGRSHKFAGAALPTSIVTAGGDVLAAPIRLVGQVSGKDIAWKRGGNFVFRADKAHAIISGWQAGDDLIVNTTTQIEFDGVMRVDLVVMPQNRKSPKIERLWLEVPLKRSRASLYHFWPGRWGGAKNSGAVPDA
ncbi:MAG: glycoside hydrolase domain-containing protein, partial [Verrucomicrobiia bacterium]